MDTPYFASVSMIEVKTIKELLVDCFLRLILSMFCALRANRVQMAYEISLKTLIFALRRRSLIGNSLPLYLDCGLEQLYPRYTELKVASEMQYF